MTDHQPQREVQHPSTHLADRLDRLKPWIDQIPPHALPQVALAIDRLALLVGDLSGDESGTA